jgi:hypothetical protein
VSHRSIWDVSGTPSGIKRERYVGMIFAWSLRVVVSRVGSGTDQKNTLIYITSEVTEKVRHRK